MPIDWDSVPTRTHVPFRSKAEMRNFATPAVQKPALSPGRYEKLLRELNDIRRMADLPPLDRLPGVCLTTQAQRSVGTLTAKGAPGTDGVLVDPERLSNQIRQLEYSREMIVTTRLDGGGEVHHRVTVANHEVHLLLGSEAKPATVAGKKPPKRTRKELFRQMGL